MNLIIDIVAIVSVVLSAAVVVVAVIVGVVIGMVIVLFEGAVTVVAVIVGGNSDTSNSISDPLNKLLSCYLSFLQPRSSCSKHRKSSRS